MIGISTVALDWAIRVLAGWMGIVALRLCFGVICGYTANTHLQL